MNTKESSNIAWALLFFCVSRERARVFLMFATALSFSSLSDGCPFIVVCLVIRTALYFFFTSSSKNDDQLLPAECTVLSSVVHCRPNYTDVLRFSILLCGRLFGARICVSQYVILYPCQVLTKINFYFTF